MLEILCIRCENTNFYLIQTTKTYGFTVTDSENSNFYLIKQTKTNGFTVIDSENTNFYLTKTNFFEYQQIKAT